jgi:hypothetical protein
MKSIHRIVAPLTLVAALTGGCGSSTASDPGKPASTEAAPATEVKAPEEVKGAEAAKGAEATLGSDALVEEHDEGTVAWNVSAGGEVKALVKTSAGAVPDDVGGTLSWKGGAGEVKTIPLAFDKKAGLLIASGPKLEGDLTEVSYTLAVAGKPWSGALHLPAGGTAQLAANARAAAAIKLPEGKLGPHGGTIQVVGDDRLELVVDDVTGEVRVYVLDAELAPIVVGERKVKIAFVAESPQVVVLVPEPGGLHFSGKWASSVDPVRVTIALTAASHTHVVLCGYRPGVRLVVGAKAPRVKVRVKGGWGPPDVNVKLKGKGHGHGKGHGDGIGKVKVDVKLGGGGKGKGGGKGGAKAGIKFP